MTEFNKKAKQKYKTRYISVEIEPSQSYKIKVTKIKRCKTCDTRIVSRQWCNTYCLFCGNIRRELQGLRNRIKRQNFIF